MDSALSPLSATSTRSDWQTATPKSSSCKLVVRWALKIVLSAIALVLVNTALGQPAIDFWDLQRKGTNNANSSSDPDWWQAAAEVGVDFVRLIPDSWDADSTDFLIGNADNFRSLNEQDLRDLIIALDDAHRAGLKVVLSMFSLPGARWKQLNGDNDDYRLWHDLQFQDQATEFWRQLSARVGDHPAVVGFNPLNEPHPEKEFGFQSAGSSEYQSWFKEIAGSVGDVNVFNQRIVDAIRESDPRTPIILDAPFYSSPDGYVTLQPVRGNGVLYAFHFYEPWKYTTFRVNEGRFTYPAKMPGPGNGESEPWSPDKIRSQVQTVVTWASKHDIPPTRIIASEFGVDRRVGGAESYLNDLIDVLNSNSWHWAFYSFRGDGEWTGLDYELGTNKVDYRIWDSRARGENPEDYKHRHDNPLWEIILRQLRPENR